MIVFWLVLSGLVAFLSILLHSFAARWLQPQNPVKSMRRFWLSLTARLLLIGGFFWQLVQQQPTILFAGLVIFLAIYAGSLYYIIKRKPQWFQTERKKDISVWMP